MSEKTEPPIDVYDELLEICKKHDLTPEQLAARLSSTLKNKGEPRDRMIIVSVDIFEPFYKFMQEYLLFFGSKKTIEDLCRQMIYGEVECLHQELTGFVKANSHFIEGSDWVEKHMHLAICVDPEPEENPEG